MTCTGVTYIHTLMDVCVGVSMYVMCKYMIYLHMNMHAWHAWHDMHHTHHMHTVHTYMQACMHTDRQADRQKYISFNTINASTHKYTNTINIHMCVYQVRKARASCFNVHSKSIARLFVVARPKLTTCKYRGKRFAGMLKLCATSSWGTAMRSSGKIRPRSLRPAARIFHSL